MPDDGVKNGTPATGTPAGGGAAGGPAGAAAGPAEKPAEVMPPQAPGWSTPTFIAGIIVGLVLIAGGLAMQALGLVPGPQSMLIVCSGLGIVLGAFGAVAVIRYQGLVIAGVAALAMALFFIVDREASRHVMISLANVPETMTAALYVDQAVPAVRSRDDQYDFYLIGPEMRANAFSLALADQSSELIFDCLPAKYLKPHLATGKTLQWRLNSGQQELHIEAETIVPGCFGETVADAADSVDPLEELGALLVAPAMAQEAGESIQHYLDDLDSPAPSVRRLARQGLARWGVAAVEPMMELWRRDPTHYYNTLGVAVALTEILREDKGQREAVSELLGPADLALLTDALNHDDRTMQVYVTEFLYDLGDPMLPPIVVEKFPEMTQEGQYNSTFVLENAVPYIDAPAKEELKVDLVTLGASSTIGPRTKDQMEKLIVDLEK